MHPVGLGDPVRSVRCAGGVVVPGGDSPATPLASPMIDATAVIAGGGLGLAVVVGLVAHEWAHALVLRLAGIDYTMTYFPGRTGGLGGTLLSCPWAVVHPHPNAGDPPWQLRLAALAPFALTIPVLLGAFFGILQNSSAISGFAIGWLACAIPSPQDFSVAFYAHRRTEGPSSRAADGSAEPNPR